MIIENVKSGECIQTYNHRINYASLTVEHISFDQTRPVIDY